MLRRIYEDDTQADKIRFWNEIPGNSGGSTARIIPIVPQAGSGTRNSFLTDLFGSSTFTNFSTDVATGEEHDPSPFINPTTFTKPGGGFYAAGDQVNMIAPFSGARKVLLDSGYFNYISSTLANSVALLPGTGKTSTDLYKNTRNLINATRKSDAAKAFVGAAFGPSGFICTSAGQSLAQSAGLQPIAGSTTCGS